MATPTITLTYDRKALDTYTDGEHDTALMTATEYVMKELKHHNWNGRNNHR